MIDSAIFNEDCLSGLKKLPSESVNTCITSPPYFGLRDYGVDGQIGHEPTPLDFTAALVNVFREVRRVMKGDGTLWLNLGDSYNAYNGNRGMSKGLNKNHHSVMPSLPSGSGLTVKTLKNKDLVGIPWRLAFALQSDGWYLRSDIIWHKPNPLPGSQKDRPTSSHEYIFLLSKSPKYYYDYKAILEPAISIKGGFRNRRDVWTVPTRPYKGAHFATFPADLIRPCILAGAPSGGIVLDPFMGAGTTAIASIQEGRRYIGFELNPEYCRLSHDRILKETGRRLCRFS